MKVLYVVPVWLLLTTGSGMAQAIPKFAATCVPVTSGHSQQACIESDGKALKSSYKFKDKEDTTASHTNCALSSSAIVCRNGSWQTSAGEKGVQRLAFRVQVNNGKPIAAAWQ